MFLRYWGVGGGGEVDISPTAADSSCHIREKRRWGERTYPKYQKGRFYCWKGDGRCTIRQWKQSQRNYGHHKKHRGELGRDPLISSGKFFIYFIYLSRNVYYNKPSN
uniref:Uncharacterized protein n=2 Tax=environmental samples TaxID=68359 RepID=A0A075H5N6_9EURY|nr:hypothetical protein [uncultured marine group II/III euryarchaeote KM3_18_H05]AIF11349.1 hypothetical protein [uncultured marine group II/III euryarchaeote KM3_51_F05]